jgi:hypothetical protein
VAKRYEISDLERAEATLWRFLDALKGGDEAALNTLIYPPSFETWGVSPGHVGGEFLEAAGISTEALNRLGIVHSARILPGRHGPRGLVAFGMIEGSGPKVVLVPTPAHALAMILDDGEWRIWGTPDPREFADAEIVGLPSENPAHGEMLSVLAVEWVMALAPHLDALAGMPKAHSTESILVAPIEGAHSIAAIVMLAFAVESLGARLVASGRLVGQVPDAIVNGLPHDDWQQEVVELLVLRNVVTHNHIWRIAVTLDSNLDTVALDESEHLYGLRERRDYRRAVNVGDDLTKRLRLHVVPSSIQRTDVASALPVAVKTFDHLAGLDVENMPSLSDHPIRINDRIQRLREVSLPS